MPARLRHGELDCPGRLTRAYERAGTGFKAFGYVCDSCGHLTRDEDEMPVRTTSALRPAMENTAREFMNLLWDRRVYTRFEGIVRSAPEVLASAERGNPFVVGVRRWWAIASALVLRRHVDAGSTGTLRWVLEQLVEIEGQYVSFVPSAPKRKSQAQVDLETVQTLSVRFRPFLNEVIYGSHVAGVPITVTFNDLLESMEVLEKITERTYAAIVQVSMRLEPIEQFEWTDIFEHAWLPTHVDYAYEVGSQDVPSDALPLTRKEAESSAVLSIRLQNAPNNRLVVTVSNETDVNALDVRLFIPHLRTILDTAQVDARGSASSTIHWDDNGDHRFGYGQAVLEFADIHGNVYRQYADVDVRTARVRNLSPVAFRVKGPIVAPIPHATAL